MVDEDGLDAGSVGEPERGEEDKLVSLSGFADDVQVHERECEGPMEEGNDDEPKLAAKIDGDVLDGGGEDEPERGDEAELLSLPELAKDDIRVRRGQLEATEAKEAGKSEGKNDVTEVEVEANIAGVALVASSSQETENEHVKKVEGTKYTDSDHIKDGQTQKPGNDPAPQDHSTLFFCNTEVIDDVVGEEHSVL
ncbi:hypothetical protein DXG01_009589 [Tephrocybe rancida]|nr:hypothetical protein DXG01_009589 [Tephrocybe rancida]